MEYYYSSDEFEFDDTPLETDYDPDPDILFHSVQVAIDYFKGVPMLGALEYLDTTEVINLIQLYMNSLNKNVEIFSHREKLNNYEKCCYEDLIMLIMDSPKTIIEEKDVYDVHYLLHVTAGLLAEKQKEKLIQPEPIIEEPIEEEEIEDDISLKS